jgi:hypothetical protein
MPDENQNQGFDLSKQKIEVPDSMKEEEPNAASTADPNAAAAQPEAAQEASMAIPVVPQSVVSGESEKGRFLRLISLSLKILWSKKFTFLLFTVAFFVIIFAVQIVALPMLFMSLLMLGKYAFIIPIVIYLAVAFISYLFTGALANQASAAYNKEKVGFGQSLGKTFKKTGKAIMVFLRTIFYSGIWLFAVMLILYALINTFAGGGFIAVVSGFAIGAASVIIMIVGSIRMVRMTLAFPKLMSDEYVSSKDAYEYSKTYTKDKWWMIISSMAAFSLLLGLVPLLFNIAGTYTGIKLIAQVAVWINLLAGIIAFPLTIIFMQVLMHELGNPSYFYRANPWLVTLTVLIQLTPFIVFAVLFLFFPKNFSTLKIPLNYLTVQTQQTQLIQQIQATQQTQQTTVKVPRVKNNNN